jgi:hypothetical protein
MVALAREQAQLPAQRCVLLLGAPPPGLCVCVYWVAVGRSPGSVVCTAPQCCVHGASITARLRPADARAARR